jgi:hypothetical protein
MKSALPSVIALGALLLGAAGSQAYGPSPGSTPRLIADPAFIKVHEIGFEPPVPDTGQNPYVRRPAIYHTDCRFGPYGPVKKHKQGWHKHSSIHVPITTSPCGVYKKDGPVQGFGSCVALPASGCICVAWNPVEKCCTRWGCPKSDTSQQRKEPLRNPQTKDPFKGPKPKPLPWSQRTPRSPFMR